MTFDSKLTTGNIITIGTLIVGLIVSTVTYKHDIDDHTAKLKAIDTEIAMLRNRIELLEKTNDKDRQDVEDMKKDLNRTVTYLQLLLDQANIKYVK